MQLRASSIEIRALMLALLVIAPGALLAESASVVASISRVLMNGDDRLGGCMAALTVDPQTVLPACQRGWVTFSCSGHYTDRIRAYRMMDFAEMALATNKKVQVWIRDDLKHDGFCFAYRIDVLR